MSARRAIKAAALGAAAIVVAAATAPSTAMADAAGAFAAPKTKLELERSPYGKVLFANGFALYLFTRDRGGQSECYDECAHAWPPLVVSGRVVAGDGVRKGRLGRTTRADGSSQLTYRGHPLYGYVGDPRGEVFCQDVEEFGGTWFAVKRSGRAAG